MSEFIISAHGPFEQWTIDGEARRNALSRAMVKELEANVARVADRSVRAVVLTGAGTKAFCAGADLKERHHRAQQLQRHQELDAGNLVCATRAEAPGLGLTQTPLPLPGAANSVIRLRVLPCSLVNSGLRSSSPFIFSIFLNGRRSETSKGPRSLLLRTWAPR